MRHELLDWLLPGEDVPPEHPILTKPRLYSQALLSLLGVSRQACPFSGDDAVLPLACNSTGPGVQTCSWLEPDEASAAREATIAALLGGSIPLPDLIRDTPTERFFSLFACSAFPRLSTRTSLQTARLAANHSCCFSTFPYCHVLA